MLATIEVAGCLCSNAEILMWKYYNDSLKRGIGPRIPKLALLLIKFVKYGIVQFLLYEYLEESLNCVYIPNIHR